MKEYIKPELIIETLNVEDMLALSLNIGEGTVSGDDAEAKGRRGTWGDLWAEEGEE